MQQREKGWFWSYMLQNKGAFLLTALLGTIAAACAGALLFTSGYLISRSALRPENVLMVYVPIVLVRAFGFSKAIFQYLERLTGHRAVLNVLAQMRTRLYRIIEPQALQFRNRFRSGDLLHLLAEDIEQLQNIYLKMVFPAITALLIYAGGIIAIGRMDGVFALLMALYGGFWLFIAPAATLWQSLARRRQFKAAKNAMYQQLTDAVFGLSDWLLSGRIPSFLDRFKQLSQHASILEKKLRRKEWRVQLWSRSAIGGAVVLLVIWAGKLADKQSIEVSWIAAISLVALPLMEALVRVVDSVHRVPEYEQSIQRLSGLDRPSESERIDELGTGASELKTAEAIYLELDQASYRYSETEAWSVDSVSLRVPQGRHMAVLGKSGAGKSTLLNLILGELQPEQGIVTANGQAICHSEQRLCSVLNQKPYLFDTTVANNIRLGRADASDEEVRKAAELAGIRTLIESLPEGYETRMEEAGGRFSGGERQRIALARVLLQDYPIVLLDEPTVGLDPLTEAALIETMLKVLKGKTVIWFTHHLIGVDQMDEVLFMEGGKISMQGKHEQLLASHARYRQLYALDHA